MPGVRPNDGSEGPRRLDRDAARLEDPTPTVRFLTGRGVVRRFVLGLTAAALAASSPSPARGQLVQQALDCLSEQHRLESVRDLQLTAADSLATLVDALGSPSGELLRAASALEQRALDRELDLFVQRETCREAARAALPGLEDRLDELARRVSDRKASVAQAEELLELLDARAAIQAALAERVSLDYPDLPPEPDDSEETLRGKLQYHVEVASYLRSVDARVGVRLGQLEEEARVLAEANRFLQDLAFLDEGGRLESGGTVRVRGGSLPGEDPDAGDMSRPLGDMSADTRDATLDFALRYSPMTPAESRRVREVLTLFRREIQKELEQIADQIARIEPRLSPEDSAPR